MKIDDFNLTVSKDRESSSLSWRCGNQAIMLQYDGAVTAELSPYYEWLLVVKPANKVEPNEAIIINADGSKRFKLNSPFEDQSLICYFVGTYKDMGVIKVTAVGYHPPTRISIESEFDLNTKDFQLVNERHCK